MGQIDELFPFVQLVYGITWEEGKQVGEIKRNFTDSTARDHPSRLKEIQENISREKGRNKNK